jgi:hypothetical protein
MTRPHYISTGCSVEDLAQAVVPLNDDFTTLRHTYYLDVYEEYNIRPNCYFSVDAEFLGSPFDRGVCIIINDCWWHPVRAVMHGEFKCTELPIYLTTDKSLVIYLISDTDENQYHFYWLSCIHVTPSILMPELIYKISGNMID